jgi:hypothetical protein
MIYNQSVPSKLQASTKGTKANLKGFHRVPPWSYSKTSNRVDYWEDPAAFSVRT